MKSFKDKSIISIKDLSKDDLILVLETARKIEAKKNKSTLLKDRIVSSIFYEPSTRTRLSFESAAQGLGARIIGFADPNVSSAKKGESLSDTAKMMEAYSEVIVVRHFLEGAARLMSDSVNVPVINAGDGSNQHPTQTLLDLYSIKKTQGRITDLHIAMVGDLRYGRTVHSLTVALAKFGCTLYFVSPEILKMPKHYLEDLKKADVRFYEMEKIRDVIDKVDVLYMTRIQKERFPDEDEYNKVKDAFVLTEDHFEKVRPNLKIMHPLPRVNEIAVEVDDLPYAYYFEQAANGIPIRQALLCLVLGVKV